MTEWPKNEWMDQWQALSRQYWNAWQDLSRDAATNAPREAASAPWQNGFEQWSRMFGSGGKQGETIERVLASAKDFTAFAQSMIQAATAGNAGTMPNWADALRTGFQMPGGATSAFNNPMAHALNEISGQGVKSFQQMMEGAAQFNPSREAKSWLGVPAFGFMREHQEHYQKMAVALIDYQEQNGRYNALILKSSQRAFGLFESKLAAREEPGRQIDSLRALYDLWVDAAEEAYAEIALSPEFREVYGAMVNAQMRVRSQMQKEVERMTGDLGMPTRSELDSIGKRLHDLRRELRNAGGAGTEKTTSTALTREVEALRREVAALKALVQAKNGATPGPKTSAVASTVPRQHQRSRPVAKKRPAKVAALRADVKESVSMQSKTIAQTTRPPKKSAQRGRVKVRSATRTQRAVSPTRTKKSVAKVAHTPSRSGHPVTSFAERMAMFAQNARNAIPKRGAMHARITRHSVEGSVRRGER